jgi:hypothetical protein
VRRGDAEGLDGARCRGGGEGLELAEAGVEGGGERGVVGEVGGVELGDLLERHQVGGLREDGVHGRHLPRPGVPPVAVLPPSPLAATVYDGKEMDRISITRRYWLDAECHCAEVNRAQRDRFLNSTCHPISRALARQHICNVVHCIPYSLMYVIKIF